MKELKKKTQKTAFKLEDINELKFMVVIAKPTLEDKITEKIEELGGRVLLRELGEGIGKNMSLELLGVQKTENIVIFACARAEDADNILVAVNSEINFSVPGVGLGFTIEVEGFMGAKGLFV